jgi:mutator protein MutT
MTACEPTRIAIAVVESDNRFLIGRRPAGVPLAGYWEFPGGKILQGESPAQAAVRECLEETELAVEAVEELSVVVHEYPHGRVALHFLRCRLLAEGQPRPPFCWVPRHELAERAFPEANEAIVRLLLAEDGG